MAKPTDVELCTPGIDLLFNNDWPGSEKYLEENKDQSLLSSYCYGYVLLLKGCVLLDDAVLDKAKKLMEGTEKACLESSKTFPSFKKVFRTSSSGDGALKSLNSGFKKMLSGGMTLEEKFTKAIILADCKANLAIIPFIRQEHTSYITSALQLKRAWRLYAKTQKQLYEMYKRIEPNAESIYGSADTSNFKLNIEDGAENAGADDEDELQMENDSQINEMTIVDDNDVKDFNKNISPEAIKRLLGAVSFGYGAFQIILSLIPPNMLKLVKFLGFEGDRGAGLKAINFTSNSKDIKAPFADLVILWYATIATPMYGFCENDILIDNEDLKRILEKNLNKYPNSSVFYYFKGKYLRSVKKLPDAIKCLEEGSRLEKCERPLQILLFEQIAWLHLMNLNYEKALENFRILSNESRWSPLLTTYICAVVSGCLGDFYESGTFVKKTFEKLASQTKSGFQYDLLALKRCEHLRTRLITSPNFYEMLVIELLLLWMCIPYIEESRLRRMLEICDNCNETYLQPIRLLFEGVIHLNLKNVTLVEKCFNESIQRAEDDKMPFAKYVIPYSYYQLAHHYANLKLYDDAKANLNKAKDNYKDFELENRIQTQMKSLNRRLKYLKV